MIGRLINKQVDNNLMPEVKAIMIGKFSVGKSSILAKFRSGHFNQATSETVGIDFTASHFEHNSTDYYLQLWDTAGQERYRSVAKIYYKGAHLVFVTVSAQDSASESLKTDFDNMGTVKKVYIFVNKTDLADSNQLKQDWNGLLAEIFKMKLEKKLQDIFFVSAKLTPQDHFASIIQKAAIDCFAEELEETLPSAIVAPEHRIDSQKASPSSKIERGKTAKTGSKCCA